MLVFKDGVENKVFLSNWEYGTSLSYGFLWNDKVEKYCKEELILLDKEYKKLNNILILNNNMRTNEWYYLHDDLHKWNMELNKKCLKYFKNGETKTWNYLTISPSPFLEENDLDNFERYIVNIMNPIYIKNCYWVIECGKDEDNPNYHAHLLFCFKNEGLSKNFKRDSCRLFKKTFKNHTIDWKKKNGVGWYNKIIRNSNNPKFKKILDDKISYFNNADKSALHQNFKDLNRKGSF